MGLEIALNIFHSLVLVLLLVWVILVGRNNKGFFNISFFVFAIVTLIGSDIYWMVYDILRSDARMPIAVNEIAENASFLLLADQIIVCMGGESLLIRNWKKEFAFSVLCVAANVALWIYWSGEWLQDIVGGLTYGTYFFMVVCLITSTEALRKREQRTFAIYYVVVLVTAGSSAVLPDSFSGTADLVLYLILSAGMIWLLLRLFAGRRKRKNKDISQMGLSFLLILYSYSCMYMSSGHWYNAFFLVNAFAFAAAFYYTSRTVREIEEA
ncbi:MAG: hypothetical protein IIY88_01410 [Eubacterium sp.]|nr:hypothetical protein [Eubacterium sp.]